MHATSPRSHPARDRGAARGRGSRHPLRGDVVNWLAERPAAEPDARGLDGEPLFTPLAECRLHAPLRLTNLIVTHGNYRSRGTSRPFR